MVVDKVIVENDVGLLKMILLGMGAAIVFVQLSTLAQEYLLAFAAVRLDAAVLDFLSRQASLAADDLLHAAAGQATFNAGSMARGRCANLPCNTGVGALLAAVYLVGAVILMVDVQSIADPRVPGDNAALRRD